MEVAAQSFRMWEATLILRSISSACAGALCLIALALIAPCAAQDYTTGDCSPIVKHIGGNVSVTCNLHSQIPVHKFTASFLKDGHAQETMAILGKFLEKNANSVFELDLDIDPDLKQTCYEPDPSKSCDLANTVFSIEDENSSKSISLMEFNRYDSAYDYSGMSYIVHQKDGPQWVHGSYVIYGFFSIEFGRGTYQGWSGANLYEVDKGQLVSQGRHKLPN
jgi:hypothetical protein